MSKFYSQDYEQVKEFVLPALIGLAKSKMPPQEVAERATEIGIRTFELLNEKAVKEPKTA